MRKKGTFYCNITRKAGEEDKKDCERELTTEEIIQAINQLRVRKSPGVDGIGSEFYFYSQKENIQGDNW